jgi:hypothetical protein
MSAASDAKIPANPHAQQNQTTQLRPQSSHQRKGRIYQVRGLVRDLALTRKVVEERDLDGAADDGIYPEPPACAEDRAGHARPDDPPQQHQVLHGRDLSVLTNSSQQAIFLLTSHFADFFSMWDDAARRVGPTYTGL